MTPEEQHAWEIIKALCDKSRKVEAYAIHEKKWRNIRYAIWGRGDIRDIIAHPNLYRIAQEEAK